MVPRSPQNQEAEEASEQEEEVIYLAADYSRQEEMREHRTELERCGFEVRSRWIDSPSKAAGIGGTVIDEMTMREYELCAIRDLADLEQCQEFVLFTTGELSRGGRHTEFGWALAKKMVIHLIGPREHTFHCLPSVIVRHYATWEAFVLALTARNAFPPQERVW